MKISDIMGGLLISRERKNILVWVKSKIRFSKYRYIYPIPVRYTKVFAFFSHCSQVESHCNEKNSVYTFLVIVYVTRKCTELLKFWKNCHFWGNCTIWPQRQKQMGFFFRAALFVSFFFFFFASKIGRPLTHTFVYCYCNSFFKFFKALYYVFCVLFKKKFLHLDFYVLIRP